MSWQPYGENTAEDRDRLHIYLLHHTDRDADGWVEMPAIRRRFGTPGIPGKGRLTTDLMFLVKKGLAERRVDNPNAHWASRRVFYRGLR